MMISCCFSVSYSAKTTRETLEDHLNSVTFCEILMDTAMEIENTAFLNAVLEDPSIVAENMLSVDNDGNSLLHLAVMGGNTQNIATVLRNEQKITSEVINARNVYGNNIFHTAALINKVEVVEFLLKHPRISSLLLLETDNNDQTPAQLAKAWSQHAVEELLQTRTTLVHKAKKGIILPVTKNSPSTKTKASTVGVAFVKIMLAKPYMPLVNAVLNHPQITAEKLLVVDDERNSLLHLLLALPQCSPQLALRFLIDPKRPNDLLHAKNSNGDTVIHLAAKNGKVKFIENLFNDNSLTMQDILRENNQGRTPVQVATGDTQLLLKELEQQLTQVTSESPDSAEVRRAKQQKAIAILEALENKEHAPTKAAIVQPASPRRNKQTIFGNLRHAFSSRATLWGK